VVAVSRTAAAFAERANGSATIQLEVADAGEATVAGSLIDRYDPEVIILVAGALPYMRPLPHQTWETFSVNWETDHGAAPVRTVDRRRPPGSTGVRGSCWRLGGGFPPRATVPDA
jgi:hypothetical protein